MIYCNLVLIDMRQRLQNTQWKDPRTNSYEISGYKSIDQIAK